MFILALVALGTDWFFASAQIINVSLPVFFLLGVPLWVGTSVHVECLSIVYCMTWHFQFVVQACRQRSYDMNFGFHVDVIGPHATFTAEAFATARVAP